MQCDETSAKSLNCEEVEVSPETVLEVSNLIFGYTKDQNTLTGVNINAKGEFIALLGPDSSVKPP